MTTEPSKDFMKRCLELADEMIEDAKILLEKERFRSAADRAYYAMYHAAYAVLASKGFKPKTHRGLISLFGSEIVKKGIVDKGFLKDISEAFDVRQASSYEIYAKFGEDRIKELVESAENFVNKMKEVIK
ncbi:MAG: HEPN domain-containing protein [Candidatus Hydrothermarchaeota archaeon]